MRGHILSYLFDFPQRLTFTAMKPSVLGAFMFASSGEIHIELRELGNGKMLNIVRYKCRESIYSFFVNTVMDAND